MSGDNVHILDMVTRLDIPPDRVLDAAKEKKLEGTVVLGWTEDGDFYFASSYASSPEVIYLMELAKKRLLEIGCGEE